jgi:hypothetical protein
LWHEYHEGKQTYCQLATKYGCSSRTIQRRIDKAVVKINEAKPRAVVVLMDTTYFGRSFGVMLFKDSYTGENLFKQYVKYETNQLYADGINWLKEKGFTVKAIVCDGRKGLVGMFKDIPVQMCQFHQAAIITRYITRKPKLQAAQELREIVLGLTRTNKSELINALNTWQAKWESFLNERTVDPETKKSRYTHRRLRSALRSIRTNLPWLFTFQDYPEFTIPNTTNAIDGHFADLKNKLRTHNGLNLTRKKKFIEGFLKA